MSTPATLWSFFLAGTLGVAIAVVAFVTALVILQRRRITLERDVAGRIVDAQEAERAWVAGEVHDDALQRIAVLRHELDALAVRDPADLARHVRAITAELEDLSHLLRGLAHRLHPALITELGLPRALEALAADIERGCTTTVSVHIDGAPTTLPPAAALALYRIAQEALHNVVRHADAAAAELGLALTTRGVTLCVRDNGRGFDLGRPRQGLGLAAMRQRAEHVGATLTVTSEPGHGTTIEAVLPVQAGV